MKKIELVALTQLLGKISSGSISHDERKGLLEVMKVAKYNLEMRDEKMRTAMKKYGIEIDPNTGRIAEGNDKAAVASFLDDMNKVDTSDVELKPFLSEAGADALWEENKLTTSERMMLDELVKLRRNRQPKRKSNRAAEPGGISAGLSRPVK